MYAIGDDHTHGDLAELLFKFRVPSLLDVLVSEGLFFNPLMGTQNTGVCDDHKPLLVQLMDGPCIVVVDSSAAVVHVVLPVVRWDKCGELDSYRMHHVILDDHLLRNDGCGSSPVIEESPDLDDVSMEGENQELFSLELEFQSRLVYCSDRTYDCLCGDHLLIFSCLNRETHQFEFRYLSIHLEEHRIEYSRQMQPSSDDTTHSLPVIPNSYADVCLSLDLVTQSRDIDGMLETTAILASMEKQLIKITASEHYSISTLSGIPFRIYTCNDFGGSQYDTIVLVQYADSERSVDVWSLEQFAKFDSMLTLIKKLGTLELCSHPSFVS